MRAARRAKGVARIEPDGRAVAGGAGGAEIAGASFTPGAGAIVRSERAAAAGEAAPRSSSASIHATGVPTAMD
jgi:hypothetical protein